MSDVGQLGTGGRDGWQCRRRGRRAGDTSDGPHARCGSSASGLPCVSVVWRALSVALTATAMVGRRSREYARRAAEPETLAFALSLPKVELCAHLCGTVRDSTIK